MGKYNKIIAIVAVLLITFSFLGCTQNLNSPQKSSTKEIVDMRGVTVTIPSDPQRVVIVDKGFILQSMVAIGVQDKIVASGGMLSSTNEKADDRDSLYLFPKILELPNIGYTFGGFNFETLISAKPDLVLWANSEYIKDNEITKEAMKKIETELKIPLVVINTPGAYDNPTMEKQYEGLMIIGKVFGKEKRAQEIINYTKSQIEMIYNRTKDIKDSEKPSTMYLGLRNDDSVGVVWGKNYGDAKFAEEVANIKNVYNEPNRQIMSAEQIIALNPDVIILATNSVLPDINILSTNSKYSSLQNVNAVKNKRIGSLGLLTWWGDFKLDYPTIMLISAKTVYPDKFKDIKVNKWVNDYHKKLYGLNDEQSQRLKEIQLLAWMDSNDF
ncbi:MAG: corrinoid ABC transporter substrate-binding protein [Candidatus Methanofastidiosum methylothiophilum]|uniref:Corrinoid ABC transporter substrate-binding protein n=1 Tax=Candidatus Methanofastidiosum methylothiophilum TaxID=1705564 RepID=A0A150IVF8_9EURY|nr:MAG: corrinoid ABC transporter substrate-binding protein [Candidatus Methanofastidiosum methylthiophilus]NMC75870.1 ABC transporter substrate-binding protein [Candidatus Methanofastidiosa archaeon]